MQTAQFGEGFGCGAFWFLFKIILRFIRSLFFTYCNCFFFLFCEAFVTAILSDGVSCSWRLPLTMAVVAEVSSVLAGGQEVEEQLLNSFQCHTCSVLFPFCMWQDHLLGCQQEKQLQRHCLG